MAIWERRFANRNSAHLQSLLAEAADVAHDLAEADDYHGAFGKRMLEIIEKVDELQAIAANTHEWRQELAASEKDQRERLRAHLGNRDDLGRPLETSQLPTTV